MDNFYIITNYQKDPNGETAQKICDCLRQKGKKCLIQKRENYGENTHYRYTDADKIPEDIQCVLALGGDGTLLQAARDLVERRLPILGINLGTLGYLAEIELKNMETAIDQLIHDRFSIEERMMVSGTAYHNGKKMLEDVALNDIVISRNGKLRVVEFNVYVDGAFLKSYNADGIILSTPTGSTGYNLSVGGPIVAPGASLMLLTAIAPHTLNVRPIVLPDEAKVTIEIGSGHGNGTDGAEAAFDGDTSVRLNSGDSIEITRSECRTRLIKTKNASFLEILREKMSQ